MSSTLTNLTAATTWSGTDLFYALVGGNSRKIAASDFLVHPAANILEQRNSTNAQAFRVYRTYTDSSNYERMNFASGAGYMGLFAETAGTGGDDFDFVLQPTGTGKCLFQGPCHIINNVVVPTGGASTMCLTFSSTSPAFGIYVGTNAPTFTAGQGSIYLRVNGSSTSTRLYVATDSSGTWTNVVTAA